MTALTRRKFIQGCFAVTGVALFGGFKYGLARTNSPSLTDKPYLSPPRYLELERSGELARREEALWDLFSPCQLCPRMCRVNRSAGRVGACSVGNDFRVGSFGPDFGNEQPIRGTRGSGSVFLSNCNLLCVFCQNWQTNHRGDGRQTSHQELANMLLNMQRQGCHNVSFITPTHLVPHLVSALRIAIAGGLNVPLCYNTGGYESLEVIKLLDGIVDIYQPDFKFQDSEIAARFTQGAPDYALHTAAAIKEMHRQVGFLQINNGLAHRGIVIRHLVLPENTGGADKLVRWIVDEFGTDAHVNIMNQYRPEFRAREYPPLDRRTTQAEFNQAMRWAREAGLRNFH